MAHAVCEGLQRVPLVLLSGELTAGLSHLTDSERPHSRPPPQCLSHSLPNLFLFSRLRVRFEWGVCSSEHQVSFISSCFVGRKKVYDRSLSSAQVRSLQHTEDARGLGLAQGKLF